MAHSAILSPLSLLGSPSTKIPALVYGTAWKGDRTADLVYQALQAGFTAIDTAAQPRHYREDLVGEGVRKAIQDEVINVKDLYIQTKFTPPSGQDTSKATPYPLTAPLETQVRTSIASSLHNLHRSSNSEPTTNDGHIDCLLLHSPYTNPASTLDAWRVLEEHVPHHIHHLGIANAALPQLQSLWAAARIKPTVVQNRFYAGTEWDAGVRAFCREREIVYQAFWTLAANPQLLEAELIRDLAEEVGVERAVALYCLVLGLERVVVLDGTTDLGRMAGDLEGVVKMRRWIEEDKGRWLRTLDVFKGLIRDDD